MMQRETARQQAKQALHEDETCYCENCGISYVWTAEEQRSRASGTNGTASVAANFREMDAVDAPASNGQEQAAQEENHASVTDSTDQTVTLDDTENVDSDAQITQPSPDSGLPAHEQASEQHAVGPPIYCPGCREILPAPERQRGLVKWYHRRKGYGFITRRGRDDLYVHRSALRRGYLAPDDLVEFSVGENRRGAVATNVRILDRANE